MSVFSDLLGHHIAAKGIKSYEIAQYCGIERSLMYKIIKGTRPVTSMDTVLLIAEFLRLTPSERTDFVESYKISMDGFENYYRRKNILELFENFRKYSEIYTAPDHQPLVSYHDISDMSTVSGQNEINHLLFHILFLETRKSDPQIRLLIQPDTDFLMNLLPTLGYENQNLSITQIICFHKSDELTNDKKDYNLACLKKILPVYCSACRYHVYYYYGDLIHSSADLLLFPYLVLTSGHALLLSKDMQSGIVFEKQDTLKFFHQMYDRYLEQVSSFGVVMNNLPTQLSYFHNIRADMEQNYCFQMLPCLTFGIPDYFFDKYIYPEIPSRDKLIAMLMDYVHSIRKRFTEHPVRFIFSEDGLQRFLETGRIPEYPPAVYRPFELSDRIVLIRQFLKFCPPNGLCMLKCTIGDLDNELFMYVNPRNGYLMFPSSEPDQLICLDITEPGLLHGFCDFCEHLDKDLFYTETEAYSLISSLLDHKAPVPLNTGTGALCVKKLFYNTFLSVFHYNSQQQFSCLMGFRLIHGLHSIQRIFHSELFIFLRPHRMVWKHF